ncbi:MAG TPA: hypothetical protein VLA77_02725 [Candidatus Saccharimonadales bacterium]|nr:hypothetical protein [Candidatus Saccharimonadales bacterium]
MLALAVVLVVLAVLLLAEFLARYTQIRSEITRKVVHILVGVFVAFWPFFLTWTQIQLLSAALLVVVLISIKLNIFKSIHAVKRNAWGEVLFAVVVGVLATVAQDKFIFMAAMLSLSLSDGLAAVIGEKYGVKTQYNVFGRTKSVVGTITFLVVEVLVMVGYSVFSGIAPSFLIFVWLPVLATIAENVSGNGTDNLVMPLLVALILLQVS